MGIKLRVTPDVLTREAGDIQKQIDDLKRQFDGIGNEVRRSRSYWEGQASDMHNKLYEMEEDDMERIIKKLKNHPVNLLKMAGLYKETEAELVEETQFLSENVIV